MKILPIEFILFYIYFWTFQFDIFLLYIYTLKQIKVKMKLIYEFN